MYVLEMFAPEFFMPNYENTIMQIMWIHSMSDAFNTFFLTRTNVIMCHHEGGGGGGGVGGNAFSSDTKEHTAWRYEATAVLKPLIRKETHSFVKRKERRM